MRMGRRERGRWREGESRSLTPGESRGFARRRRRTLRTERPSLPDNLQPPRRTFRKVVALRSRIILVVVFVRRLGARGKEGESGATRRTALAQGVSVGGMGRACFRAESRGDGIIAASEVLVAVDAAGALGNGIINEARELAACQWVPPTLELFRTRT